MSEVVLYEWLHLNLLYCLRMNLKLLTGKDEIYAYLGLNPALQIYCIGDLDDFFFPYTTWYGLYDEEQIRSLALLYSGMETPTLLLFHEKWQQLWQGAVTSFKTTSATQVLCSSEPGTDRCFRHRQHPGILWAELQNDPEIGSTSSK
jgi:hypothetical protein